MNVDILMLILLDLSYFKSPSIRRRDPTCQSSDISFYLKTLNHREVTDLSFLRIEGALNTTDEGPRMQG